MFVLFSSGVQTQSGGHCRPGRYANFLLARGSQGHWRDPIWLSLVTGQVTISQNQTVPLCLWFWWLWSPGTRQATVTVLVSLFFLFFVCLYVVSVFTMDPLPCWSLAHRQPWGERGSGRGSREGLREASCPMAGSRSAQCQMEDEASGLSHSHRPTLSPMWVYGALWHPQQRRGASKVWQRVTAIQM